MNLALHTDFPVAPIKLHGVGKVIKVPRYNLAARIMAKVGYFIIGWTEQTCIAWYKRGRTNSFQTKFHVPGYGF